MLSKRKRISRNKFTEVYPSLKNTRGSFFYMKLSNPKQRIFKVSVVVSKKIYKTSVDRHSIKRKIYSVFEKLEKEKSLLGVYIVFIQSKTDKGFKDLYEEFSFLTESI